MWKHVKMVIRDFWEIEKVRREQARLAQLYAIPAEGYNADYVPPLAKVWCAPLVMAAVVVITVVIWTVDSHAVRYALLAAEVVLTVAQGAMLKGWK